MQLMEPDASDLKAHPGVIRHVAAMFRANPALPQRFRRQAPLNLPDPSTYYGEGPQDCTDYTTMGGAGSWTPALVARVPAAAAACARIR